MRIHAALRLFAMIVIMAGVSMCAGVEYSYRGRAKQQRECADACFPFVSRLMPDQCTCADLNGEYHPEGW